MVLKFSLGNWRMVKTKIRRGKKGTLRENDIQGEFKQEKKNTWKSCYLRIFIKENTKRYMHLVKKKK